MIEETLKRQLEENEKIQECLEVEVVSLGKELQEKDIHQKFENNTKKLEDIIKSEKEFYDKCRLGYKHEGSISMEIENEENEGNYFRKPCQAIKRKYNNFGVLNFEVECYK